MNLCDIIYYIGVDNMDLKMAQMISVAKNKISDALCQTEYSIYINEIVKDYVLFIKICIEKGLIRNEKELSLFEINEVKYFDGNAYASWLLHSLTLQKRFFVERTKEERRNVLFHELIHSLMEQLFNLDNSYYSNFLNYIKRLVQDLPQKQLTTIRNKYIDIFKGKYYEKSSNLVCEAMQTFNEATTQYLAELLTNYSYGKSKRENSTFDSKIMVHNSHFKSFFVTYPEYEQLFINFLRTLNGFGGIEDNDKLFCKWFDELKSGYIWDHIIGTYNHEQNKELLLEFLAGFAAVRKAKESSMGIDAEYLGDRNLLTKNLVDLDTILIQNLNRNKSVKFPHENIPDLPTEHITNKFTKKL